MNNPNSEAVCLCFVAAIRWRIVGPRLEHSEEELNSIWNPRPHRLHSIDRHLGVRDGIRNDGCSERAGRCGDIDST
jgi:hypothetical protein